MLFLVLIFALLFVGCDDGSSSSVDDSSIDEVSSSSSSKKKKSSSSSAEICDTDPYFREGFPTDRSYVSSFEGFVVYGSDVGCAYKMDGYEATLKYYVTSDSLKEMAKVPVTATEITKNKDSWDRSWKYTMDFDSVKSLKSAPDGKYMLEMSNGKSRMRVDFFFYRTPPAVDINAEYSLSHKDTVYMRIQNNGGDDIRQFKAYRVSVYDYAKKKTVFTYDGWNTWTLGFSVWADHEDGSWPEGMYGARVEAIGLAQTKEIGHVVDSLAYENKGDELWAYLEDENGKLREKVNGSQVENKFWVDRTAPKMIEVIENDIKLFEYENISLWMEQTVKLRILEPMMGRESQKIGWTPFDYYAKRNLYDTLTIDSDSAIISLTISQSVYDSTNEYIYFVDETGNKDSSLIGMVVFAEKEISDFTLSQLWSPANIPSKKYDCKKYKCVITDFLNEDVEYGELLDERDNQVYRTVKIGDQEWMAQNLNLELENSYCYNDDTLKCARYGRLYPWNVAMEKSVEECPYEEICDLSSDYIDSEKHVRGICPDGWHMPTEDDYRTLLATSAERFDLDEKHWIVTESLRSQYGWGDVYSDSLGFAALGGGYGVPGEYGYEKSEAHLMTSDQEEGKHIFPVMFNVYRSGGITINGAYDILKDTGISVRCLKD